MDSGNPKAACLSRCRSALCGLSAPLRPEARTSASVTGNGPTQLASAADASHSTPEASRP